MKRAALALGVGLSASLLGANAALAFSDPDRFTEDSATGGGGGRFFTGSPVDGYSCKVCHQDDAQKPRVLVTGLPTDGYVPGQTYDVEIRWDEPKLPTALQLEILDRSGGSAGEVTIPKDEEVGAAGRCGMTVDGDNASYLVNAGRRRIVGVQDCGAGSLRFRFKAPDQPDVAFAATLVRSDASGSVTGDGVTELSRVINRVGEEPAPASGGCSVNGSNGEVSTLLSGLWACIALLVARRKKA